MLSHPLKVCNVSVYIPVVVEKKKSGGLVYQVCWQKKITAFCILPFILFSVLIPGTKD